MVVRVMCRFLMCYCYDYIVLISKLRRYIVSEVMDCDLGALINSPWGCPYELQGEHFGNRPVVPDAHLCLVCSGEHIQFILYQVLRGLKYIHSAEVSLLSACANNVARRAHLLGPTC